MAGNAGRVTREILEWERHRIVCLEDEPCWECCASPVEQVYIPVKWECRDPQGYAETLVDAGWADIHVIGSAVCVAVEQICKNKSCKYDARRLSPLEKLALQAPESGKKPQEENRKDLLDWMLQDPR